ncbi:TB2/DP1, HVA22 family-domain-containing protein [Gigaspora margarita]|uniref:Protein YOP1 n=1 Tax=Gigaspora margarita TaxID=4874 RepID=A0A8H4A867_GIGMA|nr:TB2/DP1, HVA22 family-domain-containing protein [Gigaspora margarita]
MDQVTARLKYFNAQADKELSKYPKICELEERTNVPKTYMAAGVVTFVFTLIFFNVWGELLSDVIGWLYPAYASFKAIESPEKEDDVQWLTYWTVYGFINMVEFFSDIILYWVPFYFLFKTVFFLWLFLPPFRGAQMIYTKFLGPTLRAYEGGIDDKLKNLKDKIEDATKEAVKNIADVSNKSEHVE